MLLDNEKNSSASQSLLLKTNLMGERSFKIQYGHCLVPKRHAVDPQLGTWVCSLPLKVVLSSWVIGPFSNIICYLKTSSIDSAGRNSKHNEHNTNAFLVHLILLREESWGSSRIRDSLQTDCRNWKRSGLHGQPNMSVIRVPILLVPRNESKRTISKHR